VRLTWPILIAKYELELSLIFYLVTIRPNNHHMHACSDFEIGMGVWPYYKNVGVFYLH